MTPEAAIYGFLSGFGLEAYASASVPDDASLPYLSYDLSIGEFDGGEVPLIVSAWFRTESEATPNAWVRTFGKAIGRGGTILACDGGAVWIKRGTPFSQSVAVTDDTSVKQRYIICNVEFLTE